MAGPTIVQQLPQETRFGPASAETGRIGQMLAAEQWPNKGSMTLHLLYVARRALQDNHRSACPGDVVKLDRNVAVPGPIWGEVGAQCGRSRATSVRSQPCLVDPGPMVAEVGQNRARIGRTRAKLGRTRPVSGGLLANTSAKSRKALADLGRNPAKFCRSRAELGRAWPKVVPNRWKSTLRLCRLRPMFGPSAPEVWASVARIRTKSIDFGPSSTEHRPRFGRVPCVPVLSQVYSSRYLRVILAQGP